jgi:hypothetical protein
MLSEAPSAGSNGSGSGNGQGNSTTAATTPQDTRRVENMILMELSATLNTLTSISQVLDDISAGSTVASHKQHLLIQELRQWKDFEK